MNENIQPTSIEQDEKTIESTIMTQKIGQTSTEAQNGNTAIESSSKMMEVKENEHPLSHDEHNTKPSSILPSSSDDQIQSQPQQTSLPTSLEFQSNDLNNHQTTTQSHNDMQMLPTAISTDLNGNQTGINGGENEAISVRRHLLINAWGGFSNLTRFRKWILILRLLIALAQVAVGIAVLALPSSLGDSTSYPEECDPEGMFVYLTLHCARVLCSLPVDLYLGLSPHRSPRARRVGADGLLERERNRRVGSLRLDRKMGKFGDLLGFCHIVLFIVGNYVVWTSVECSHQPADSRPLFFTCIAMLCITYVIILEVALMVFLVVFFLPLLITCLSALGLAHRLPQRDIHPETGKISQDDIEKYSKIVYYTPAEGSGNEEKRSEPAENVSMSKPNSKVNVLEGENGDLALISMGEKSKPQQLEVSNAKKANDDIEAALPGIGESTPSSQIQTEMQTGSNQKSQSQQQKKRRLGRLIGLSRREESSSGLKIGKVEDIAQDSIDGKTKTKYPLYPIPAHRATCPICLSDYEEVKKDESVDQEGQRRVRGDKVEEQSAADENPNKDTKTSSSNDQAQIIEQEGTDRATVEEPEPLRLLRCGHVMHKQCVDQWLTAVSGRCPVCQKAILSSSSSDEGVTIDQSSPNNGA